MEVIRLETNQRVVNAIRSGKINYFIREIRPETNALFCELDEEGYVKDVDGVLQPRQYKALKLSNGQDSYIFSIEKAAIELFEDRNGKLITYEVDGKEYIKAQIVYYLNGELQEYLCSKLFPYSESVHNLDKVRRMALTREFYLNNI